MKKAILNSDFRIKNVLSSFFVIGVICVAFLGANIRPDKTKDANEQLLSIARLPPLSKVSVLRVKRNQLIQKASWWQLLANGGQEYIYKEIPIESYEFQRNRLKVKVKNTNNIEEYRYYLLADILFSLSDSTLSSISKSNENNVAIRTLNEEEFIMSNTEMKELVKRDHLAARKFVLGTDQYGRDVLSRLMAGSYVTLVVGFSCVFLSVVIGVVIGVLAGYYKGITDRFILWLMNVFWSIPSILVVIAFTILIDQGVFSLIFGISFILWVEVAQVIRGEVRSISNKDYIKATRLMGLSNKRILWFHILPNLKGPILVLASNTFAQAILLESGLNFLGVGIELPRASWGGMVRELYGFILSDGAFLAIIPSLAIILLVLAIANFSKHLQKRYNVNYRLSMRRG